jgi:hypothetical protein
VVRRSSLGIVAVSVLVTWALHLTGWGKPPGRRDREQWGMRVVEERAVEMRAVEGRAVVSRESVPAGETAG